MAVFAVELQRVALLALLSLAGVGAFASDVPVRCTGPDGKVTYQSGACPKGIKTDAVQVDPAPDSTVESWTAGRSTDRMTGVVTCAARSPRFMIPAKREWISAQLAVIVNGGEVQVLVENRESGSIFHHNIRGTGLKVGEAGMIFFGARPNQTVLTLPPGTDGPIVDSMQQYTSAVVRVRFWPWDEQYDSRPIPLQGFKQALAQAKLCTTR